LPVIRREHIGEVEPSARIRDERNRAGWQWPIDVGLIGVLALPLLVVGLDTSWLFAYSTSTTGYIDPWVYFGFFLDLTQHIKTFKGAYFTTRLAWTVPGAIVYRIFPALTATYVLHLAVFYASIVSLYLILKNTVSRRAAMLSAVVMAFHSYFLWSVGWPYIDGAGNAYLLMTMAALTYAARRKWNAGWLFAAGMSAALTIHCQIFLMVLSPVVLGYYYFARKRWGFHRSRADWRPFGWGLAAVTAGLGLFNMTVNGRFFFFANAMGTAAKLMIRHNPYGDATYRWFGHSPWLVLPVVVLAGAVLCLRNRRRGGDVPGQPFLLFWLRFYVVVAGILAFFQVIGQPILQQVGYASYLLPGAFLALGGMLGIATNGLSRGQFALLCLAVTGVSAVPLVLPVDASVMQELRGHGTLAALVLGTIGLLLLGRAQLKGHRSQVVAGSAVVIFVAGVAVLNAGTSTRTWDQGLLPNDAGAQKSALLAIVDSARTVKELDPHGNLYFWYDGGGRLGMVFRAVASTYLWAYRLESESFPQLGTNAPPVGRRIVILTEDGDRALVAAEASLVRAGLEGKFAAKRAIREGPFSWEMVEVEVMRPESRAPSARSNP
jgi:hypothetical protein